MSSMSRMGGPGVLNMLKDGTKHFAGTDEAILKNIEACKQLSDVTQSSMGPNGMNKMVVNHLEKIFVTHDAATILLELEVFHPAAKLLVQAAHMQEQEIGDGTNLTCMIAGNLLYQAGKLLESGLHVNDILDGYDKAYRKTLEILNDIAVEKVSNLLDVAEVTRVIRVILASKVIGYEDVLAPIVAQACTMVCPQNPKHFNTENVRVVKIEGGSIFDSHLVHGFVVPRNAEGTVKHVKSGVRIAAFNTSLDVASTETKGTVLIHSADELLRYNSDEERLLDDRMRALSEAGVNVILTGGSISDIAMHFVEKHRILAVKVVSKHQLRRLCLAVGATPKPDLSVPSPSEIGQCASVSVEEIGSTPCVVFRHAEDADARVVTLVIRGGTQTVMNDAERAIDDGIHVYRALTQDARLVPGAGAAEVEIAVRLKAHAATCAGLEQYAVAKFGEAFEAVPRVLAHNAGLSADAAVTALYAAHHGGNPRAGVNVFATPGLVASDGSHPASVLDVLNEGQYLYDPVLTKLNAVRLATDAVLNILRVDQIIMSKPAGGPKPPQQ